MNIKYFVRTTQEREFNYDLDYELLIDKEKKPVESFINQLRLISESDSVLLEDDLILCKDFKNKIENVIKQYPNRIINFFTDPRVYFTTHLSSEFMWNQCTYYPKGIGLIVANEMEKMHRQIPSMPYDQVENNVLKRLNIPHIKYRPCLVQHLDNDSLIMDKTNGSRRSIYFEDYLNELNIDYIEAFTKENNQKLQKKLYEDFQNR